MPPGLRLPQSILAPVIEWKARRIADPVERLRFLRRMANGGFYGPRPAGRWKQRPLFAFLLLLLLLAPVQRQSDANITRVANVAAPAAPEVPDLVPNVWLVENKRGHEIYSNGLRVETGFTVSNTARSYHLYDLVRREDTGKERSMPAGIVFHTTESHLAPFRAEQNRTLKQIGEALIEYVRRNHSYHYVIDRFGRVWRVVAESDVADHAGYSVWADSEWLYVNLNRSFLGVSFEAQTRAGDQSSEVTPAQIVAGRLLTEMLRSRYRIPSRNCVTHAQVSVNPRNQKIGYHTDWAANFPYAGLNLGDNYSQPTAALWAFGFAYDPVYVNATGSRLWQGLALAEDHLRREAAARRLSVASHRRILQRKYQKVLAALESMGARKEKDDHEAQ